MPHGVHQHSAMGCDSFCEHPVQAPAPGGPPAKPMPMEHSRTWRQFRRGRRSRNNLVQPRRLEPAQHRKHHNSRMRPHTCSTTFSLKEIGAAALRRLNVAKYSGHDRGPRHDGGPRRSCRECNPVSLPAKATLTLQKSHAAERLPSSGITSTALELRRPPSKLYTRPNRKNMQGRAEGHSVCPVD